MKGKIIKTFLFLISIGIIYNAFSKSKKTIIGPDNSFSNYITAFTSGEISSKSKITIEFNSAIKIDTLEKEKLKKILQFKPKIAGEFSWINDHILQFSPANPLENNTNYTATLKLNMLTENIDRKHKKFEFNFHTIPQKATIVPGSLILYNSSDMEWYYIEGEINMADVVDTAKLRSCFSAFQGNKKILFSISENSENRYYFRIDSIQRGENASTILLDFAGSKINAAQNETFHYDLASLKDFSITDIRVEEGETQNVLITFSDPLSIQQSIEGLIDIEKETDWSYSISRNQLTIFLSNHLEGRKTITINGSIKNSKEFDLKNEHKQSLNFLPLAPQIKLIGNGNILPNSQGLFLPFESINIKTGTVRVVKIYNNNIHQFLQINNLDGSDELRRVGKKIVEKQINLDFKNKEDIKRWTHHGLDLNKLIKPDLGAIYRISIKFDKNGVVYACDETLNNETENTEEDEEKETADDNEDYTYIYDESYDTYDYYNEKNPCDDNYYYGKAQSRNIIASNIGIIFKLDNEKKAIIFTTDMNSTAVLPNTRIQLFNYSKQILAEGTTNSEGVFSVQLKEHPFLVVAKQGNQFGYLKTKDGYQNSLSRFDVSGIDIEKGFKGFIYGERGVWRPGDSIYISFIMADYLKKLPDNYPVSCTFSDPDGKILFNKTILPKAKNTYNICLSTSKSAPTGHYQVQFKVGNQKFFKTISIETVKPNRIKIEYQFADSLLTLKNANDSIKIQAQWLFGNVAKHLKANVICQMSQVTNPFPKYKAFTFLSPELKFEGNSQHLFEGTLNQNGNTKFLPKIISNGASSLLSLNFITNVIEKSGNINTDNTSILYCPFNKLVGIKVPNIDSYLYTNTKNNIEIITLNPYGNITNSEPLRIQIWKMETTYWYESDGYDYPDYIAKNKHNIYLDTLLQNKTGKLNYNLNISDRNWGKYLIIITEKGGHQCGKVLYFDSPYWNKNTNMDQEEAAILKFNANKEVYQTGEKIILNIPATSNGNALISIEKSIGIINTFWAKVNKGNNKIEIPTTEKMTPNIFIHISLIQPHIATQNGLPIRMYGVIPVLVENPKTHLNPVIQCKDEVRPEQNFSISIKEKNGKPMTYTLAIVDEGLLNLTHFKTPKPWNLFYAKEALNVETWDMYDQVIGAYAGKFDKLLSIGGDGYNDIDYTSKANRFVPIVNFFGTFTIASGATRLHNITLPNYTGSVRVMVVANNDLSFGQAEKEIIVKKPILLLSNIPRVLTPQDEIQIPINIFATNPTIKDVKISLSSSEHFILQEKEKWIHFNEVGDEIVTFKAKIGQKCGIAKLEIKAISGNETAFENIEIAVRTPQPRTTELLKLMLPPKGNMIKEISLDAIVGTEKMSIEASFIPDLGIEKQLSYLIQYPHGCIEQTTSSVFPQLYLSSFVNLDEKKAFEIAKNIQAGIDRILLFQNYDGGFSYWPNEKNTNEYGTNYAGHFLIEAKKMGYEVPEYVLENWYDYQKSKAKNWVSDNYYNDIQAYRLYTLSLNGTPEIGAMNQLKSVELSKFATYRLASAYNGSGYSEICKAIMKKITIGINEKESSYYYGSQLREMAIELETLILLDDNRKVNSLQLLMNKIRLSNSFNTQEAAFYIMAISNYYRAAKNQNLSFIYALNQQEKNTINTKKPLFTSPLDSKFIKAKNTLSLHNNTNANIYFQIIKDFIPTTKDTTFYNNGINLVVTYLNMENKKINVSKLPQGYTFKMEVSITNTSGKQLTDMALEQLLPSGWEIITSDNQNNMIRNTDIRDDRIYTYYDLPNLQTIKISYLVNASFLGNFFIPSVFSSSMYNNKISAKTKSGDCIIQ